MSLSAAAPRARYGNFSPCVHFYPIKAGAKLWHGALICVDANGYAVEPAASLRFVGVAMDTFDNTAGEDGDIRVDVDTMGDYVLPFTGAAFSDVGSYMYCSADDTLTKTVSTNPFVGVAVKFQVTDFLVVRLNGGLSPYIAP